MCDAENYMHILCVAPFVWVWLWLCCWGNMSVLVVTLKEAVKTMVCVGQTCASSVTEICFPTYVCMYICTYVCICTCSTFCNLCPLYPVYGCVSSCLSFVDCPFTDKCHMFPCSAFKVSCVLYYVQLHYAINNMIPWEADIIFSDDVIIKPYENPLFQCCNHMVDCSEIVTSGVLFMT